MRLSHLVILVLLCVIANGLYDYQKKTQQIAQLQAEIATLKENQLKEAQQNEAHATENPPKGSQAKQAAVKAERYTCPVCHGEGRVPNNVLTTDHNVKRMAGANAPITYHNCPCCGGSGYRLLQIPPDGVLCPDCGGMGKVPKDSYGVICRRCNGTGWIMPRDKIL